MRNFSAHKHLSFFIIAVISLTLYSRNAKSEDEQVQSNFNPAVLREISSAQFKYARGNIAVLNGLKKNTHASSTSFLGGTNAHKGKDGKPISLINKALADAKKEKGYKGYYFVDVKTEKGKALPLKYVFAVCAIPCEYGKTGTMTYYIDSRGSVVEFNTAGKPVTDVSQVDDKWVEHTWEDPSKKDEPLPPKKPANPSTLDIAAESPQEMMVKFVDACNNLDSNTLCGLFTKDSDVTMYNRDIQKSKKNPRRRGTLSITVGKITKKGSMTLVDTLASFKKKSKFEYKDDEWVFEMIQTPKGYKISRVRFIESERKNGHFRKVQLQINTLNLAAKKQDWRTVASLIDAKPKQKIKLEQGDINAYKEIGLDWLHEVIDDKWLKLEVSQISRISGDKLKVTVKVIHGDKDLKSTKRIFSILVPVKDSKEHKALFYAESASNKNKK